MGVLYLLPALIMAVAALVLSYFGLASDRLVVMIAIGAGVVFGIGIVCAMLAGAGPRF